jgi:hypothetical protein
MRQITLGWRKRTGELTSRVVDEERCFRWVRACCLNSRASCTFTACFCSSSALLSSTAFVVAQQRVMRTVAKRKLVHDCLRKDADFYKQAKEERLA